MKTVTPRPRPYDWMAGLALGSALGALILGVAGRAAMRIVALMQEAPPYFTVGGSMTVVSMGAIAGACFAIVLLALQSVPRLPRRLTVLVFCLFVAIVSLRVLRPVDRDRLLVFPPLVALFVLLHYAGARRLGRVVQARHD